MSNKVLVLASVASMIEQFNMSNIEILIDLGYEVHVACNFIDGGTIPSKKVLELKDKLTEMSVCQHQIDYSRNTLELKKNLKAYRQTLDLFIKEKFKFVHCHSPIGGVCARIAGKRTNTKVIYTAHGFHFFKGAPIKNWLLFYPIEKLLSNYTSDLVTINKEDYKIAKNKFNSMSTIYIPGVGVDTKIFDTPTVREKVDIRKKIRINMEVFMIIYVGELSNRKNQLMILEAVKSNKNEFLNENCKFYFVGTGPNFDIYADFIQENKLEEIVVMMGYRDDIADLMKASDLAISASRQEGLPVNIMEAMATGLPLIVTDCRGNSDLVTNNSNGIVVSIDDIESLSLGVLDLVRDSLKRRRFEDANRLLIKDYDIKNIDDMMLTLYSKY